MSIDIAPHIVQGETFNYRATVSEYPAGDGWTLTLYLNPRAGGSNQQITSTADGDAHLLQAAAAVTETWAAGAYAWEVWATLGSERYRLEAGQLDVKPGLLGVAAGLDTRSQAEVALADAKAAFAAWTPSTRRYTIGGRQMEFATAAEIIEVIRYWENEVRRERAADRSRKGLASDRRVVVRMGRA